MIFLTKIKKKSNNFITFINFDIFINMGRKKIEENKKKVKISVAIDPELPNLFKLKHINLSSLVNKLLKEYIENEHKNLL
jgi:hypothetical protein